MKEIRNSKMFIGETYFWTNTIKDWNWLLEKDSFKKIIIDSWRVLVERKKIEVHAFVIMPNHLHCIWTMLAINGKEMPYASFNKYTAHEFLKHLRLTDPSILLKFEENDFERNHRFWQRDPLAVLMDFQDKIDQKIEYIHNNPLQEHWKLCDKQENYKW